MPFTPSHIAAALPFVRGPLLPSAVAIGTVAPDLPYFVPLDIGRGLTHTVPGIVTADLAIGIVVFLLWLGVFRAPLVDLSPAWLRLRMPPPPRWLRPPTGVNLRVLLVPVAIVVGAATHLAWDAFSHPGWLVDHVSLLRTQLGPLALFKWLQHAGSILGLVVIAVWVRRWVVRTDPHAAPGGGLPAGRAGDRMRIRRWMLVGAVFVASGLVSWAIGISEGFSPFDPGIVFRVARISIGLALGVAAATCLAWHVGGSGRARRAQVG